MALSVRRRSQVRYKEIEPGVCACDNDGASCPIFLSAEVKAKTGEIFWIFTNGAGEPLPGPVAR